MKTWIKRAIGISALSLGAVAVGAPRAEAGTISTTFVVSTTVNAACTADSTPNLTFPTYVSGQATTDTALSNFTVTCPGASAGTPNLVNFTFSTGSGSFTMTSGTNNLAYGLYQDSAYTTPYPYGAAGGIIAINQPAAQTVPIYGQIGAAIVVPNGNYAQTVTALLTY